MKLRDSCHIKLLPLIVISLAQFPTSEAQKLQSACRFSQFRCTTGLCLDTEKLCNGVEDCPEGEDEKGNAQYDCTRSTLSDDCSGDKFRCRFGGCISNTLRCNGVPDCWGGTDEASDFCGAEKPKPVRVKVTGSTTTSVPSSTRRPTEATSRAPPKERTTSRPPPPPDPPSHPVRSTYPPPPPQPPKRVTTTTKRPPSKASGSQDACPPIELTFGQTVSCFVPKIADEIECDEIESPAGTTAEITCRRYWVPPETGPNRITRECKNGQWTGSSSRLRCALDCGIGGTAPAPYVVGGSPSEPGKWPWHAGLYENDPPGSSKFNHICGATLINPDAVLTAAHCVTIPLTNEKKNAQDLRVYLGKYYRTFDRNDDYVQPSGVRNIYVHKDYHYHTLNNDIAILHLEKTANITDYIRPVCTPDEEEDDFEVGTPGILAGWGSTGDRVYPENLQEAKLPVQSTLACKKNSPVLANLVRETTFCAGTSNGTSACDGDSGGGLVFSSPNNKYFIQGIVSGGVPKSGSGGCDPKYFAAFTKVVKYRRWIDKVLDRITTETLFSH